MKYSPRFAYTFTPSSSLLDLSANAGFSIRGLVAVIDSTAGLVIFAAGTAGLGYSALSGGNVLTLQASLAGTASIDNLVFFYDDGVQQAAVGDIASAAPDAGNPVKIGGQARLTNPAAVTDGQRVNGTFDKVGRQLVVGAPRALKGRTRTNIAASTAETTIVAAGAAGVFNDLYGLVITNGGVATMAVTIRDATAGTPVMVFQVPATDTRGMTFAVDSAMVQAAAANNWTATCTPNATSVDITALYAVNV